MSRELPHRASIRLPRFDYASPNWYYVTICTKDRQQLFVGADYHPPANIIYSSIGIIAQQYWEEIPQHYPYVSLDQFVIMPNHVHGIIIINDNKRADNNPPPTYGHRNNRRNYYEHIIRDEGELNHIRKYIADNPRNWNKDKLFVGADYHPPANIHT